LVEAKLKATVEVAQRFLVRVGMRTPPPENVSFDSGSVRFVLSTKNRCVVAADVSRHGRAVDRRMFENLLLLQQSEGLADGFFVN
jgi:hypothetical protein